MFKEKNKSYKNTMGIQMAEDATFKKLKDFVGQSLQVHGYIFVTKDSDGHDLKFGKTVSVAIDNKTFVTLPKRYVEEFESFSDEEIDAVTEGKLTLANIREIDSKNGKTICFDYADTE